MHYARNRRHGDLGSPLSTINNRSKHPLWSTYSAMRQRCYGKNWLNYVYYGGRGIKVCDRWLGENGLANFTADMGSKPTTAHSIDRINNDGDYEPSNCRWADRSVQSFNTRIGKNNKSGYRGVSWNSERHKWRVQISNKHIGYYASLEDAVSARRWAEILGAGVNVEALKKRMPKP